MCDTVEWVSIPLEELPTGAYQRCGLQPNEEVACIIRAVNTEGFSDMALSPLRQTPCTSK